MYQFKKESVLPINCNETLSNYIIKKEPDLQNTEVWIGEIVDHMNSALDDMDASWMLIQPLSCCTHEGSRTGNVSPG